MSDAGTPPAGARATLRRVALLPGWVVCAALAALAAGVTIPPVARTALVALGAVLFVLPHRGLDPIVAARARSGSLARRPLLAAFALYLLGSAVHLGLWIVAPALALALLVVLAWLHLGLGDLHALRVVGGADHPRDGLGRALLVLVRGGLPLVVPVLAHPRAVADAVAGLDGLVDPLVVRTLLGLADARVRLVLGGWIVATTLAAFVLGRHRGGGPGWRVDVAETLLLWAYFALVPPLLALGLYLACWHALRHLVRAALLDPVAARALHDGRLRAVATRLARDAAPLSALLVAVVVAVAVAVRTAPPGRAIPVWLVVGASLSLPHVLVVAWLDREAFRRGR